MKKMKQILTLLMALVVVLGMSSSVFAATISVTQNAGTGGTAGTESYEAYKIFDVTKTSDVTEPVTTDDTLGPGNTKGFAYSVAANSPWLTVLQKEGQNWVELTASADGTQYSVKWKADNTEAAAIEFADWLLANKGEINADATFQTGDTKEVADGYYLITSSLGTNLILATSNITITEKNEYITDNKTAEESSYNVGDKVPYTITVNIPASVDETKKATVHDTLPPEFDFQDDVAATVDGAAFTAFTVNKAPTDGHSFDIEVTLTGMAGKSIVFTYTAEVTNRAVADTGYINTEFTSYSNYETTPKTVEVKTFDFDLEKTDGSGEPLDGAVFELKTSNNESAAAIEFITVDGGYEKADSKATTKVTELKAGSINVAGLAAGTYYLFELEAPKGYNKLEKPIIVTIAENGTVTLGNGSDSQGTLAGSKITVTNQEGTVLPSTGGMGTTIFYVLGTILVIGAAIVLVSRRRMSNNK